MSSSLITVEDELEASSTSSEFDAVSVKNFPMLTTIDNPFNPFSDYESWSNYDESQGYHTASYLARIAKTSDELSDTDNMLAIEDAINEIVFFNVLGIYKKVYE